MSAPRHFDVVHEFRLRYAVRRDDLKGPGAFVRLPSGSPVGVIVDLQPNDVAEVAWIGSPLYRSFHNVDCLRWA